MTELIADKLIDELSNKDSGTFWATLPENEKAAEDAALETTDIKENNGGADGTRTRDLQRDRLAF